MELVPGTGFQGTFVAAFVETFVEVSPVSTRASTKVPEPAFLDWTGARVRRVRGFALTGMAMQG